MLTRKGWQQRQIGLETQWLGKLSCTEGLDTNGKALQHGDGHCLAMMGLG